MSSSSKPSPIVIPVADWNPSMIKYMKPKVNDKGGKSISTISTQSNRGINVSLPLLMTWGISDYVDEKTGESDGKYKISLQFPNEEYATADTAAALKKLKDFEEQIIDDAVKNSEVWFGEKQSREIVKYGFFPFVKYSKVKGTKTIDYSRPPCFYPKVPQYENGWGVEVYDTKGALLFPSQDKTVSPLDLVPRQSRVATVISCGGIWVGGKGWGITWKLVQCVVKPQVLESVFGKCHIQLSPEDVENIAKPLTQSDAPPPNTVITTTANDNYAENSDDEDEAPVVPEPEPEPVVIETPAVVVAPVTKKIVKKAAALEPASVVPVEEPVKEEPAPVAEAAAAPKKVVKKIVKKTT